MAVLAVVIGVGVSILDSHTTTRHHSTTGHHHHAVGALVVMLVVLAVVVGLAIWLSRKMWRGTGNFAAPLTFGLPRRQRREVLRSIRRGTPSKDPTLAAVGRETAERLVRQTKANFAVFGLILAGSIIEALTTSRTGAKVYFAIAAVVLAGSLPLHVWYARGARRYLARDAATPIG